jgi:4-oxalocrotonate tautomerase
MPHVIVKLLAGRSEPQKTRLAEEVSRAVVAAFDSDESSVSVAIEEVQASDWTETVYKPDIIGNMDRVYKKPGYDPL